MGGGMGGNGMPQMGLSVNPNQHYEMLKLHHMNLLNEIQETTLMMNLYQQQQLQQQQQQLQQQQLIDTSSLPSNPSDQILQLAQQQQLTSSGGNNLLDSIYGVGGTGSISSTQQQLSALQSQTGLKQTQNQMGLGLGSSTQGASNQMQALLRQQNLLSGGMLSDNGLSGSSQRQQQQLNE